MNKLVGIYERRGTLFISPYHKTETGFWVGDEEIVMVDSGDFSAIAGAVIAALSKSREGVSTPERDFDPTASLLNAAGVASFSAFAKSAKSLTVELVNGILEITPDKYKGSRDGFVPMIEKTIRTGKGDKNLGKAVVEALNIAC